MGSEEYSMPMDDASFSEEEPMVQNPNQEPQTEMGQEELPMDPNLNNQENGPVKDDSTMGIINQLSSDDKDAVRAYAESLLNKNDNQDNGDEESTGDGLNMEAPVGGNMAEAVIFTKAQLDAINENFNNQEPVEDKPLNKKTKNNVSKKSPFNTPKFD